MSALDVLRQIKAVRRAEGNKKAVEWGNADFINDIGVENLTRRELRNHLEARDLITEGTRLELIERLRASLSDEQLHKFAFTETLDTEFLILSDLEERGSVYVVGNNVKGQLGIGDLEGRPVFVAIPQLRGIGVNYVHAGQDMCYAITDEHDVYVWGGGGVGKTGINKALIKEENDKGTRAAGVLNWLEPVLVKDLGGEEVCEVVIGLSHCLAVGTGGDCFLWGDGQSGQLGLGDFESHPTVVINSSFPAVQSVRAGSNHSVILTRTGKIYSWGHSCNGRLGIGTTERLGVPENEKNYFPIPMFISTLEPIKTVCCGYDHTLAHGYSGVWAWGNGAGGRLGLGDNFDRNNPCIIPKLRGKFIMQIVASAWHSLALVAYPPLIGGGWVYSWGSGFHGQLAQGQKTLSLVPEFIEYFCRNHLTIKTISAGSHHCAALTKDGEMYTWGSNKDNCLARKIDERDVNYTPIPGHCGGFGVIVGRTGRGFPRSISCGKEFTIVCTWPYTGPNFEVATKLMEEARVREQEEALKNRAAEYDEKNVK
jgi:alpha-tubulin suppressor-like RCC1 family protein